jgi:hypothetical protein
MAGTRRAARRRTRGPAIVGPFLGGLVGAFIYDFKIRGERRTRRGHQREHAQRRSPPRGERER